MRVVARLLDKTLVKGDTTDFHSENEYFTIRPAQSSEPPVRVLIADLKALYFVRSFDGDRDRSDHREFQRSGAARARLWLEFKDGEQMAAWPVSPALGKVGFYVIPTDTESNIEKAWVHRRFVKRIFEGREAERAAAVYARSVRNGTLTVARPSLHYE